MKVDGYILAVVGLLLAGALILEWVGQPEPDVVLHDVTTESVWGLEGLTDCETVWVWQSAAAKADVWPYADFMMLGGIAYQIDDVVTFPAYIGSVRPIYYRGSDVVFTLSSDLVLEGC